MKNVTIGTACTNRLKKDNKGVTLIALVVTIIILLILAGISVATLSGENGLINRAADAKEQTEISQEKEILQQASVSAIGKSKTGDLEKTYLDTELSKYSEIDTTKTKEVTDGIEVTFKSGRTYTVNFDGDVIQKNSKIYSDEVKVALTEGKYVTYNGKPYRVLYDVNSGYDWIEIVSVNPLESVQLGFADTELPSDTELVKQGYGTTSFEKARWSYNNAITTLHSVAQKYLTNLADRARCVGSDPKNPLNESDNYNYPENFTEKAKQITLKDSDSNYTRGTNAEETEKDYDKLKKNQMIQCEDTSTSKYFWLASRNVIELGEESQFIIQGINNGVILTGRNLCTVQSGGSTSAKGNFYGFRPVIRLKDSIKITGGAGTSGSPYTIGL